MKNNRKQNRNEVYKLNRQQIQQIYSIHHQGHITISTSITLRCLFTHSLNIELHTWNDVKFFFIGKIN